MKVARGDIVLGTEELDLSPFPPFEKDFSSEPGMNHISIQQSKLVTDWVLERLLESELTR